MITRRRGKVKLFFIDNSSMVYLFFSFRFSSKRYGIKIFKIS